MIDGITYHFHELMGKYFASVHKTLTIGNGESKFIAGLKESTEYGTQSLLI